MKVRTSIRELAYDLRPPALDHLGLLGAIEGLVDRLASTGVEISFVPPKSLPSLAAAIEVAAYKIIREGLANIERHARATSARLELLCDKDLSIRILDNGRGFDPANPRGLACRRWLNVRRRWGGRCKYRVHSVEGLGLIFNSHCSWRPTMDRLTILIADDHPVFRDGIRMMLNPNLMLS